MMSHVLWVRGQGGQVGSEGKGMTLKSLSPRDVPLKAMPPIQRFYNLLKQSHQSEDQVFKHQASGRWCTIYNTSALTGRSNEMIITILSERMAEKVPENVHGRNLPIFHVL